MRYDYTVGCVSAHLRRHASHLAVFNYTAAFYLIFDVFFAGIISADAIAALTYIVPLLSIASGATGGAVEIGFGAVFLHELGGGKRSQARQLICQGLFTATAAGIITTAIILLSKAWVFEFQGGEKEVIALAQIYILPIALVQPLLCIIAVLQVVLVAHGHSKVVRSAGLLVCLLNLPLNTWFMFGGLGIPPLGIQGIAVASVLAICAGGSLMIRSIFRLGILSLEDISHFFPKRQMQAAITKQALPVLLGNLLRMTVAGTIYLLFVIPYGSSAVAAYGVSQLILNLVILPSKSGVAIASFYVAGQNSGAGNYERVNQVWLGAMLYSFLYLIPGFLFLFFFGNIAISIFTGDSEVVAFGARYLRIISVFLLPICLVSVNSYILQSVKKQIYAPTMELGRRVVLPLIFIPLLEMYFGIDGIWLAEGAAHTAVAIVGCIWVRKEVLLLSETQNRSPVEVSS